MIFSALSCTQSSAPRPDTPVVGVILPYSSAFTAIANEQENAIKMALADSGQSADLVFVDCGGDNAGAVEAYKKVMSGAQKPHAIISCASWVAETLHPLAAEDDVFHIVIGSAAFERSVPRHTVRFTLDAHEEERQLAAYLKRFDRIAIFNMDNGYGNNWAEVIRRGFGDKIVTQVAYDPKSPSFEKLLQPVKAAGPDALVLLSAGNAARIAEEARRMGIDAQLIGTRPIERPELLETKATEGLVYTYPSSDKRHPMVAAYKAEYQSEPTIFAMEAYDSLRTLLLAMQVGGDSTEDLFTWYAGRTYTGALGEVVFDLQGDATYAYLYKEIANGEFRVAEFQYDMLLEDVRHEILSAFLDLSETMEEAAGDLSMSGLTGDLAQEHIDTAFKNARHAYDVVTVDLKGTIVAVAPTDFSEVVGADIS
ncbi:MAG: ABC transporter substrate-binding protein, partial [Candidatus Sumerlaeota bacterium]